MHALDIATRRAEERARSHGIDTPFHAGHSRSRRRRHDCGWRRGLLTLPSRRSFQRFGRSILSGQASRQVGCWFHLLSPSAVARELARRYRRAIWPRLINAFEGFDLFYKCGRNYIIYRTCDKLDDWKSRASLSFLRLQPIMPMRRVCRAQLLGFDCAQQPGRIAARRWKRWPPPPPMAMDISV